MKIPPQMKMYFEVITRMKSYYTVIFDQKHLTFSHPNRDRNSNLHVFHWIRSHVKYNYDADYVTACLFYITRFHSLPRPSRNFHKVKMRSYCKVFLLRGIAMEWNHRVISFGTLKLLLLSNGIALCRGRRNSTRCGPCIKEVTQGEHSSDKLI